jgi:RNA polymerase sigma-70 factor (ECF subfamily)
MNPLPPDYSDDQLFALIQQGDEPAFNRLLERYRDLLFTTAYYTLKDEDEAKDVLQEVFVWFWAHRATIQINTTVKAYLKGAVRQGCANMTRRKVNRNNRQQTYASLTARITGTSPLETKELGERLDAAMALISPISRKAFIMLYVEEKSLKEIAVVLNIKVQTAKNHVQQALKILRQHLQKN